MCPHQEARLYARGGLHVNFSRPFRNGSRVSEEHSPYKYAVPFVSVGRLSLFSSAVFVPGIALLLQEVTPLTMSSQPLVYPLLPAGQPSRTLLHPSSSQPDNIGHQLRDSIFATRVLRLRGSANITSLLYRVEPLTTLHHRTETLSAIFQGRLPAARWALSSLRHAFPPNTSHVCFDTLWQKAGLLSGDFNDVDALRSAVMSHCMLREPPVRSAYALVIQRQGTRQWADAALRFFSNFSAHQLGLPLRLASYVAGNTTFCNQAKLVAEAHVLFSPKCAEFSGGLP